MSKTITYDIPASKTAQKLTIVIPDATVNVTQPEPTYVITGGTPIDPPVVDQPPTQGRVINFSLDQIPLGDPDFVRNGAGANQFYGGNGSQTPLPGTSIFETADNDQRFPWKDLQTAPDKYNWQPLDIAINKCILAGQKLSFRVMTCDSGQVAYPSFIPSLKANQPDFNSELYVSSVEKFVAATANHLETTESSVKGIKLIDGVYKVDVGGIGNWNEMHWDGLSVPVITAANGKRLLNAHVTNYNKTRLMITISGLTNNSKLGVDLARALLNASNSLGPVGIRCDHLGWIDTFAFDMNASKYWAPDFLPAIKERYKSANVAGELMNTLNGINAANPYSDLLNEVKAIGLSQLSNNNWCRIKDSNATAAQIAASDINIRAASKAAGARVGLQSGNVNGSILNLTWINAGNSPVYEKYNVVFEIRNGKDVAWSGQSNFSPTGLLPGTKVFTDTIGDALGDLYIIIQEAAGVRKPLQLANKNRQADGSYKLCTIV